MLVLLRVISVLFLLLSVSFAYGREQATSWQQLDATEAALEQARLELVSQGYTSAEILRASREGSKQAREFLLKADAAQKEFQVRLDTHNQNEFDFYMSTVHELQERIAAELEADGLGLSHAQKEKLEKALLKTGTNYSWYMATRGQFGTPQDWKRSEAIRRFFIASRDFYELFQRYTDPVAAAARRPALKQKLLDLGTKVRAAVMLAPRILGILVELIRNRQPTEAHGSPLMGSINSLIRTWMSAFGYKVEVTGREHLPVGREAGTINILAPTHRDEYLDHLTMGELRINDLYIFGAVDHFAPKIIGNLADKSHSFIVVGRGSGKPIDKIVSEIGAGGSQNVYIFPEGMISAGIGETRPPRENFVRSLILRLKTEGYKVNLIPITLLNSSRFMGDVYEPSQKVQRTIVHPPISDAMLGELLAGGDEQAVNRVLRAIWLETLDTDAKRLMGQLRVTAFGDELAGYLGCERLLRNP